MFLVSVYGHGSDGWLRSATISGKEIVTETVHTDRATLFGSVRKAVRAVKAWRRQTEAEGQAVIVDTIRSTRIVDGPVVTLRPRQRTRLCVGCGEAADPGSAEARHIEYYGTCPECEFTQQVPAEEVA